MFDKKQALWIGLIAPLVYPLAYAAGASVNAYFLLSLAMAAAMIFGGTPPKGQESVEFTGHDLLRFGGHMSATLALCMAPDFIINMLSLEMPALRLAANWGWLMVAALVFAYPFYSTFMGVRILMRDKQGAQSSSGGKAKVGL